MQLSFASGRKLRDRADPSGEFRRRGAAVVEMAVVAPVLILLLGGIIQFGGLFFLHNNMVNAAREAARALAVKKVAVAGSPDCSAPPAGSAEELACNHLSGWASTTFTLAVCNPTVPGPHCDAGSSDVAVEITVPLSEASLWDALGLFQTGTLEARVIMREEP